MVLSDFENKTDLERHIREVPILGATALSQLLYLAKLSAF